MRIVEKSIRQITIDMVSGLDPIRVVLEDIGPGKGRINIECYSKSWVSYWGAMGDRTISEFIASCGEHYLAGKLSDIPSEIFDDEGLIATLKKDLLQQRRSSELSKDEARELFDEIETTEFPQTIDGLWHTHYDLLQKIIGDDWWNRMPTKENPAYAYLCRVIRTVKAAFNAKEMA